MLSHDYNRLFVKELTPALGYLGGIEVEEGPIEAPVAFMMFAVGGRTQGIGVIASWYTTHAAQSRIDWAITENPEPPEAGEFSSTAWTSDFVREHEILFPSVLMSHFHWFRAYSRNAAGQVLSSPLRGIYYVPGVLSVEHFIITDIGMQSVTVQVPSLYPDTTVFNTTIKKFGPIASISPYMEGFPGELIVPTAKSYENVTFTTNVYKDEN